MSKSTYARNKDLDHRYGGPDWARPAIIYVQLHTANPTGAGTVGQVMARVAVTNNATNWPAASGGSKQNGTKISWGTTAGQTLGTATYVSTWDSLTGGNMLDYAQLGAPMLLDDKLEVSISAGAATFNES